MTVGEITEEHYGWIVAVDDSRPYTRPREIDLLSHRSWTYQGKDKVGLVDASSATGRIRGTEYHYPANTPCHVVRQWRKPRKKR
jgi:hypothetical protein